MRTTPARGFTLLELILSLAILAALGVLALSSLSVGAKGFMSSRADVETSQRARLALTRMTIDLRGLTSLTTAQDATLTFKDKDGTTTTLTRVGNTITLNGNTLIENLATYPTGSKLFTYHRADGVTAWTTSNDLSLLYEIVITLRLTRAFDPVGSAITHEFTASLNPRNTGAANSP